MASANSPSVAPDGSVHPTAPSRINNPSIRETLASARIALTVVRQGWLLWIVTVIIVQGLLVWVVAPLLDNLFRGAMRAADADGINLTTIIPVFTNVSSVFLLAGFFVIATSFIFIELAVFACLAHLIFEQQRVTFSAIVTRVWRAATKLRIGGTLGFAAFSILLVPLSGIGIASAITTHVAIPQFVSGELAKMSRGTLILTAVTVALAYLAVLFCAAVTEFTGTARTFSEAMRRSSRLMWFRAQFATFGVFVASGAAAIAIIALVSVAGGIPVALAGDNAAQTMAAVLPVVRGTAILVGGFLAAYISAFLVAMGRGTVTAPPPPQVSGATRTLAVGLIMIAVVALVPQMLFATAATQTERSEPTLIIGHRGDVSSAVENSIAGLESAAAAGADMVEIDVQETADEQFAVIHDASLTRLTGDSRTVRSVTMAELARMTQTQNGFTAPISSLAEYVDRANELGVRLLIEVKPTGHESGDFAERFAAALEDLDPSGRHMVQSLDVAFIAAFTSLNPQREVAFVVGFQLGGLPRTPAETISLEDWSYADLQLASAHESDKSLFIWTLNDAMLIRQYLARGVDGIITDTIRDAVELRTENTNATPLLLYTLAVVDTVIQR